MLKYHYTVTEKEDKELQVTLDIIIWTLAICTLFLFFGKTATPFINNFINRYFFGIKERKNNHDGFDQLVEYKKSQMRGDVNATTSQVQTQRKNKNAFQKRVEQLFDELSKSGQKKELEDVRKVISLFDNLNWGTGDEIKSLAKKLGTKIGGKVSENQCSKILNKALKEDYLQRVPSEAPLNVETICQYLVPLTNITLLQESVQYQKKVLGVSLNQHILNQAIAMTIYTERNNINNSLDKVLSSSFKKVSDAQLKSLVLKHKSEDLKESLKSYISLLQSLNKLGKEKGLSDKENALKILRLPPTVDQKTLKRTYKTLVLERHPDKMSSYGLNELFTKQINENFTNIQWAYDILLSDLNNSK